MDGDPAREVQGNRRAVLAHEPGPLRLGELLGHGLSYAQARAEMAGETIEGFLRRGRQVEAVWDVAGRGRSQ